MIVMLLMIVSILVLLGTGFPIALVLGATGAISTFILDPKYMSGIPHTIFNTATAEPLIAVPLFILMGQIIQQSKVAERFYLSIALWLRPIPGGLLHSNITVCTVFSAVSGSSVATAATVATAAMPNLDRLGYDRRLSTGTLAAGGTLGILIPPSIPLIVYGSIVEESIGSLFVAAIVPAILLVSMFHAYIFFRALMNPSLAPTDTNASSVSLRQLFLSLRDILPVFAIVLAVLGGIYAGWTTSTEAAAVGVLMAFAIAAGYGAINVKMLRGVFVEAIMLTSKILFIVIGAQIFSYSVFVWGINSTIGNFVANLDFSPTVIFFVIVLIYLTLGMFVDALSLMLMTIAIVHPIVVNLGYDSVWFGVVLVLLLEVGLITPPVGMNLFTIKAVSSKILLSDVAYGSLPFVLIILFSVALLVAFPMIVLWLPFYA